MDDPTLIPEMRPPNNNNSWCDGDSTSHRITRLSASHERNLNVGNLITRQELGTQDKDNASPLNDTLHLSNDGSGTTSSNTQRSMPETSAEIENQSNGDVSSYCIGVRDACRVMDAPVGEPVMPCIASIDGYGTTSVGQLREQESDSDGDSVDHGTPLTPEGRAE